MTSVEEAVSLTRTTTTFAPIGRAVREPVITTSAAALSPRVSATLEHRQQWERRFRSHLRITDTLVIIATAMITAAVQMLLLDLSFAVVVRDAAVLVLAWCAALGALNSRATNLFGAGAAEYGRVANASGVAIAVTAVLAVVLDWDGVRSLVLIALPVGTLALLYSRLFWRKWLLRRREEGGFASRALVIGDAEDVEYVIRSLRESGDSSYQLVGATLFGGAEGPIELGGMSLPVLGRADTIAETATVLGADTVIVASRAASDPDYLRHLAWQLEGTAAEMVLSSRLTDVAGPRVSLRQIEGLPLIQVRIPTYDGDRHVFKRTLDVIVSTLALIPIGLAMPFIALAIKLDSRGPVFFFQERVGRDGRMFKMVKFRSMRVDAEQQLAALAAQDEGNGVLFKMRNDPRITRVGAILRKFSLDELPQFWNALVGDMSVVGPRPPLPTEVDAYERDVYRRLYVKPGITGPWQVGGRSDLTWEESVRLDLRYVENWSVMNDVQIMWRTAKVMVRPSGAY